MADKKISELDLALQINNDAVFPFSQQTGGEDTTYKASITQLGAEVAEDQTFSNLQTTSKKLVGAINELNGKGSVETATITNTPIASFPDGADNVPVKSLEVDIEPNLSGVSSVNVVVGGDNLVTNVPTVSSYDVTVSYDSSTNEIVITNTGRTTNFSNGDTYGVVFNNLISGHTYAYKCSVDGVGLTQTGGDASILPLTFNGSVGSVSFRITKDYDFVSEHPIGNVQRVKIALCDLTDNGTTYPISLGGTYYGGTLDVKNGSLTVKYARVDLGSLGWTAQGSQNNYRMRAQVTPQHNIIANNVVLSGACSVYDLISANGTYSENKGISGDNTGNYIYVYDSDYNQSTSAPAFTTAMSGKYLTYELATPTTVTLTPTQVKTLLGNNNIFADCGNVDEVTYFKTGCESIARLIEAYL